MRIFAIDAQGGSGSEPRPAPRGPLRLCVGVWLGGFAWHLLLFGLLFVLSDGGVAVCGSVFLQADTNSWVGYADPSGSGSVLLDVRHPGIHLTWLPFSRAIARAAGLVLPPFGAAVVGCVLPIAAVGGLAIMFVWLIASDRRWGLSRPARVASVLIYALGTASLLVSMPESYGYACASLVATMYVSMRQMSPRGRLLGLAAVGMIAGLTTITNFLLPALCQVLIAVDARRWRAAFAPRWLAAGLVLALILAAGLALTWGTLTPAVASAAETASRRFRDYGNLRLIHDPVAALEYSLMGLASPLVGAGVVVSTHAVSLEPMSITNIPVVQMIAGGAWLILLIAAGLRALRAPESRRYAVVLILWIVANQAIHNLYGDEYMLYSPHWAWALVWLVIIGWRGLPRRAALAACAVVILGEVASLAALLNAARVIVQCV